MEETKNILQSKTLWLNLLGPLFLLLNHRYGIILDPDTELAVAVLVMGIANAVLRKFTSQPVTILPTGAPK